MNKERLELFVQELETTDAPQVQGRLLAQTHDLGHLGVGYCALGIATLVALKNGLDLAREYAYQIGAGFPSWVDEVREWYGFEDDEPVISLEGATDCSISEANDSGSSFWDIAQALRAEYLKEG